MTDPPFVGEVGGRPVYAERGDPAPLDNRADKGWAELEALRLRAEELGIDPDGMPLRDLEAAVAEAEKTAT